MRPEVDQRPETLHELFDSHRIEFHGEIPKPGREFGGRFTKLLCPECEGGREREKNFFVLVDTDSKGATWHCFRATCGFSGGGRLAGAPRTHKQSMPRVYVRPEPPRAVERPDDLIAHYAAFGISRQTVEALGIYRAYRRMPELDDHGKQTDRTSRMPVIVFPYRLHGGLVNNKFKAIYPNGLKRFLQEQQAEPSLFNIDSVTASDRLYIVEGEDDVAAMYECGFRQTVTLPNGSPDKLSAEYDPETDDDQRYEPLRREARLREIQDVFLAGDMDAPGARHHEEIARRIGKARCWFVRWPEGCKDAKETLTKRGPDAVRYAVSIATRYPLEAEFQLTEDMVDDIYHGRHATRHITGHVAIDRCLSLPDDGVLTVLTGYSGSGKSSFINTYALLQIEHNEELMRADFGLRPFHTIICSLEYHPLQIYKSLVKARLNKAMTPEESRFRDRMTIDEARQTALWVDKHFTFIDPGLEQIPTHSWMRERVAEHVQRTGAKLVIVDPVQNLETGYSPRLHGSESNYIGSILHEWVIFCRKLRTNVVMVAHPSKPKRSTDGKYPVPTGYDIMGSQSFNSRPFLGVTVERPDVKSDEMILHNWKSKDRYYGVQGSTGELRYDVITTRIWPKPEAVSNDAGNGFSRWSDPG